MSVLTLLIGEHSKGIRAFQRTPCLAPVGDDGDRLRLATPGFDILKSLRLLSKSVRIDSGTQIGSKGP